MTSVRVEIVIANVRQIRATVPIHEHERPAGTKVGPLDRDATATVSRAVVLGTTRDIRHRRSGVPNVTSVQNVRILDSAVGVVPFRELGLLSESRTDWCGTRECGRRVSNARLSDGASDVERPIRVGVERGRVETDKRDDVASLRSEEYRIRRSTRS